MKFRIEIRTARLGWLLFGVFALILLPYRWPLAAEEWRNPNVSEINALFQVVTRELPNKMVLSAEIDIREPSMSAKELDALIVRDIAKAMAAERRNAKRAGGELVDGDLEGLRESIAKNLRRRFSGTRKLWRKEYYSRSGMLYRNDHYDFANLDTDSMLRSNILSGNIPSLFTEISLGDPAFQRDSRFPKGRSLSINHGIKSASVHKAEEFDVDEPKLWRVFSMEPELAFPVGVLLAEADSIPVETPFNDMILGARLDTEKLAQALEGEVMGWTISAREETIEGQLVSRVDIGGQANSLFSQILAAFVEKASNVEIEEELKNASLAEYSYWMDDLESYPRLLRARKRVPGSLEITSHLERDKQTGSVTLWKNSKRDLKSDEATTVIYRFSEIDINADFSEEKVFGFGQLASLDFVDYGNRIVQHPEDVRILEPPGSSVSYSLWMRRLGLFSILLLPILLLRKRVGLP